MDHKDYNNRYIDENAEAVMGTNYPMYPNIPYPTGVMPTMDMPMYNNTPYPTGVMPAMDMPMYKIGRASCRERV